MLFYKKCLTTTLLVALLFSIGLTATAQKKQQETFKLNYIISDQEMTNYNSMNQQEIQAFLEGKNSFLSIYKAKGINDNRKTASEIIYDAAQRNKINPKYLLVKLQKEQSLIKDRNPSKKQINWATGYGVCDGCRLSNADVQQHKGFANQVDSAAGIIRWYYENFDNNGMIKQPNFTYQIDGKEVEPTNLATAFLYTYTPHIHGNKNFWQIWKKWFNQKYPDGSLLKSYTSNDVYLIDDNKKRKFENYTAFKSRFDPDNIIEVTTSELERYEEGKPISLPNYAVLKLTTSSKYYLLDYDTIRPFKSKDVVRYLGYHPAEIIEVNKKDISGYEIGATITKKDKNIKGELARMNNKLYYIKGATFHPILDMGIAKVNFPDLTPIQRQQDYFEDLNHGKPITPKEGSIFGVTGTNKIYVVENDKKRYITNEEVFSNLGYDWSDIVWLNKSAARILTTGEPIFRTTNPLTK